MGRLACIIQVVHAKLLQSCLTLCNAMDCNPRGSSVHGIFQARILEWIAISSSRDIPHPEIKHASLASPALAKGFFTTAPPGKLIVQETKETRVQFLGWEDPWRRNLQPTSVFLPGKFHGQRNLVGYIPWGRKESNATERLSTVQQALPGASSYQPQA